MENIDNNSKMLSDNSKVLSGNSEMLSDNSEMPSKSPFAAYEEKFCNICSEYNSCIGLISSASTSIGIEDTNEKQINTKNIGDKMFLDMVKGMGVSLYAHKFKMILDCMDARKLMKDI